MISFSEELDTLERKFLKRSLRWVEGTDQGRLTIGNQTFINFSSNNYLGLARHPQVVEPVKEVLDHWGAGATASRLISGSTVVHEDLERALAAFQKTEAALLFPSGYTANLGVITSLVGPSDAVIMDRLCHASWVDAVRLSGARLLVYRHGDADDAERVLVRAGSYRRRVLVTDSLFSMDGDFAPLRELAGLACRYGAISVLDEAHAIGVWGEGGRGARALTLIPSPVHRTGEGGGEGTPDWDVVVGTLSKALGSQGGFVCGSKEWVDTLINKARSFIFTTGLSPVCVAAAQAALSLIQKDPAPRRTVQELSARLRENLKRQGWNILNSQSQIVPILLGETERALAISAHLEEEGIFAPAIRPPTVHPGQCRIRFSITAEHTDEDIKRLLEVLKT